MAGALTVGAPALLLGPISHSGAVYLLGSQTDEDTVRKINSEGNNKAFL